MKKLTGQIVQKVSQSNGIKKIQGGIASTGSMDRDGDVLVPEGWELDNFKSAPRLLWSHDVSSLPIGKVTDIRIENGKLLFDAEFAMDYPFASQVAKMVPEFINTVSVGYIPKKFDEMGRTVKQELLEISLVNVPANADAQLNPAYKEFVDAEKKELSKIVDKAVAVAEEEKPVEPAKPQEPTKPDEEKQEEKAEDKPYDEMMMESMKLARDHFKEGIKALEDVMGMMSPKGDEKSVDKPKQAKSGKATRAVAQKALKRVDRIVELALREVNQKLQGQDN